MIAYEELCAALERHRADHGAPETAVPYDAPTGQTVLPPNEDDQTSISVQAVYDDRSNELDIGDVLSDEEAPKKH